MSFKYQKSAVGGTFDRLHAGHRALLKKTFELSEFVMVGITSDSFIKEKLLSNIIESYPERYNQLIKFLDQSGYGSRYEVITLEDIYGTTVEDVALEAIFVTSETVKAAGLINQKRQEADLSKLDIELVSFVNDQKNLQITSSRIRNGSVSPEGVVYETVFSEDLTFKSDHKHILKKPMDKLLAEEELKNLFEVHSFSRIALVGDEVLKTFLKKSLPFNYAIYDGQSKRKLTTLPTLPDYKTYTAKNRPSMIEHQAVDVIRQMLTSKNALLKINGEEDLLVLVMIMTLPLKSLVLYGQPDKGVVAVHVTEDSKDRWYQFLQEVKSAG